ncbi:MAG TPA: class I SAM-dependent methyltransferase, partial [Vicinamibacteria bacterium]
AAAAGYARGNPLLGMERAEMAALWPDPRGMDVLDLGAGTGYYARWAGERGARRAIALDGTPEMLAGGARPAVVADAGRLPFGEGRFDLVVAALLLSFVGDAGAVLAEAARVLRPGGWLLVSDLHPVASERGWSRSFEGPRGQRLRIEAPPPSAAALREGLAAAGLRLDVQHEPVIDERLRPAFVQAGRRDFEALAGTPLLLLLRARKGGGSHAG